MALKHQYTSALLPWGDVWDDFLDSINMSLDTFCTEGPGGWILGYIDALNTVGVRTVLILISARVDHPVRYHHAPTGATITVLPATKAYRYIRSQTINPNTYLLSSGSFENVCGRSKGIRKIWHQFIYNLAPYVVTPIGLLNQELRRESCQAILCQEYESPRFDVCVLLGRWIGLPVFASFQGRQSDPILWGRLLRRWLTMKLCHGLVIGSQTEIQRVRKRYHIRDHKIAQVFNPIDLLSWYKDEKSDLRLQLGIPEEALVVVWHGRVDFASKGLAILLDAWQLICDQRAGQQLRLVLMGTGKDAERLRVSVQQLPLQNVIFLDRYISDRNEIRRFLSAGDVYAFPSIYEGFPVAPIEAMACSLPLIAAEASGVPDILEAGEDSGGVIVPCGDVEAFASALGSMLDSPERCRWMGKRARHRVEQAFSLDVVGQQLRAFMIDSASQSR